MHRLNKKIGVIGLVVVCLGVVLMGAMQERKKTLASPSGTSGVVSEKPLVFDSPDVIFIKNKKADGTDKNFAEVLSEIKGKVIYIDFWASWCGPCRGEMPYSHKLYEAYQGKEVAFLFISFDYSEQAWQKGIDKLGLKGYHFYPNEAQQQEIGRLYQVEGIPRYMLVNRSGKVVDTNAPRPSSANKIKEKIDQLLK